MIETNEMLEKIINSITVLDRRFTVIEQNMKEVLNRMNMLVKEKQAKPSIESTTELTPMQENITEQPPSSKATKVFGKIKHMGRALVSVKVTVTDSEEKIVKETKTNRAGEWLCFLPEGRYKAQCFLEGIMNASVNFQVKPNQTFLRVGQPQ